MISNRMMTLLFAGAAYMVLAPTMAEANLLTNGSFELGTFVNDGNATMVLPVGSTTITGWTVVNDQLAWIDTGNPWGLSAQEGNRFLDFTAYPTGAPFGGVAQDIATVVGQQYKLTFYLGSYTQRWGGPPVSILANANGTTQTFTVSTTSTASTWTPFSLLFTATSTTATIALTGTAGFQYIGLDNVSVDPTGPIGEVPELPTLTTIGAGTALLVIGRIRKRRS